MSSLPSRPFATSVETPPIPGFRLDPAKHSMKWGVYLMTPEAATHIISNLHLPTNRNDKPFRRQALRADLLSGNFLLTHQGIAFNEDGLLCDGQNRLMEIASTGVTVPLLVFWNVPNQAMSVLDSGTPRSAEDAAKISGRVGVTKSHASAARRMIQSVEIFRAEVTSTTELVQFIDRHREAIDFAVNHISKNSGVKGIATGSVFGAVARAYYHIDRAKLTEFCHQLQHGSGNVQDMSATVASFRTFLLQAPVSGGAAQCENYRKCERCLQAFSRGEKLSKIYAVETEQFPIPEDAEE